MSVPAASRELRQVVTNYRRIKLKNSQEHLRKFRNIMCTGDPEL
jgi:hypothetical protein